jgi:hypothetical protein
MKKNKKSETLLFPPSDVLRTFKQLYPQINLAQVEWSWEVPLKIWEADFEWEGKEHEVEITVTGHHLLTEVELTHAEVPEAVMKAVKKHYPEEEIGDVECVFYSNQDVHYEFDIKRGKKEFEAHFREDGLFIGEGKDL